MALVILTIQDEEDGNVSFGFTGEPAVSESSEHLTDAQILGMLAMQAIMSALNESQAPPAASEV